jgi:diguanylate cyclase (GGDEF)-like protein
LSRATILTSDRQQRLESRLERERRARREAEQLLETKSRELYEANRALSELAAGLEQRVEERTRELLTERQLALETAETDALTNVCNRTAFGRKLATALSDSHATGDGVAVFLIDLDDFKAVNDTFGHAAGDALLVEFASRLGKAVRPGDVVARLGGDEFALIAHGVGNRQGSLLMAHRLLRTLCRPAMISGRSVPCSCSIGLADSAACEGGPDELLRDADLALYASKREGRACVTSFDAALRIDVERRAALDAEVREAVCGDRIEPWYQPIWHSGTTDYVGAEVLARWRMPDGVVRSPADFLSSVETLGLLDTMMENMLRHALCEARAAVVNGSLEYLSINVSPSQFNQGWAVKSLPGLLAETRFPAHALVVEITETALLNDLERTRAMLVALTSQGMRIALDDFGVGYSNFSLLGKLPFDMLKLDRTLVCDIETDNNAHALAECILALASRLQIKVVAEGVETQRQAEMLMSSGCTSMQGFWFARPQRDLSAWFAAHTQDRYRRSPARSNDRL